MKGLVKTVTMANTLEEDRSLDTNLNTLQSPRTHSAWNQVMGNVAKGMFCARHLDVFQNCLYNLITI